jgi:hypothetical protein
MVYAGAGEWQRRMGSSLETAIRNNTTRKLGGEIFHHWVSFVNKRSAEEAIYNARAFKFRARMVKGNDIYEVYVRRH